MSVLDWGCTIVIVLLAIRCMAKGLVQELASVAAWAAGLIAALLLYRWAGALINSKIALGDFAEYAGFAAAFVCGYILMRIFGRLLKEGLEAAKLGKVDSFLGFIAGALEGLALVSLILIIVQVQPLIDTKKLLAESIFARTILPVIGPTVDATLKPIIAPIAPKKP